MQTLGKLLDKSCLSGWFAALITRVANDNSRCILIGNYVLDGFYFVAINEDGGERRWNPHRSIGIGYPDALFADV